MTDRVDKLIDEIKEIHTNYWKRCQSGEATEEDAGGDVLIVSHGHYSRCFLARWSRLPLDRGEVLIVDAGCESHPLLEVRH